MPQLQKVLWSKGVLLNPQHLQLQDRYMEELLGFRLDTLSFCPWGFSKLEFDREALAGGVVVVTEAAGLLFRFDLLGVVWCSSVALYFWNGLVLL
jgi:type VI secretion system protein ImpJ